MNDVNNALGRASPYNQAVSLNDTVVRTLLGRSSGAIALSDAYGKPLKTNEPVAATVNSNNINIYDWAVASGWDKSLAVVFTVNSGVTISSTSTSIPAITTGGPFPNGLTIVNNGTILGKGGTGGTGSYFTYNNGINPGIFNGGTGGTGGPAISLGVSISLQNNGIIGGGGGGGGGGAGYLVYTVQAGGGGGGGAGFGAGGPIVPSTNWFYGKADGTAGAAGTATAGGTGGGGGPDTTGFFSPPRGGSKGGSGGNLGSFGATGEASKITSVDTAYSLPGAGGAPGKAIALNGKAVTFVTYGTISGAVS